MSTSDKEQESKGATPFTEELDHQLELTISKSEEFIERNKNRLITGLVAVVLIIAGYYYIFHVYFPGKEQEAQSQAFMAQKWFESDSFDLAIKGKGGFAGFEQIADEYGSTKIGKLANYYLGVSYLRKGKFNEAIEALDKYNGDDMFVSTIAMGAKADALLELGKKEEALEGYEKAASHNENALTTPIYLQRAALLAESLGKKEKALELFKKIKEEYKTSQEGMNADKYIGRIEAAQ
jgi:tetratricopeptide (TPR) repeat protein